MACNLTPAAYEKLLEENKQWLLANSPDSLEREHIIAVMEASAREYRNRCLGAINGQPHCPCKMARLAKEQKPLVDAVGGEKCQINLPTSKL